MPPAGGAAGALPAKARSGATASGPRVKSRASYHNTACSSGHDRTAAAASVIHCARSGRAFIPNSATIIALRCAAPQA